MKRREFLGAIVPAVGGSLLLQGMPLNTYGNNPLLQLLSIQSLKNGRVFVLIQLNGGNDGLNTLIPIDQYSNLYKARKNILLPENKILRLSGSGVAGLHPAMGGIQELYNGGYVSIIQGVGYPNPDFSHFRATDIWLTGSDSNQYFETGWIGRLFDEEYPGYPAGYPNADMSDPPAIQIGSYMSPLVQGNKAQMGMSISDPGSFYQFASGEVGDTPDTAYGHELKFIRYIRQQSQQYFDVIKKAAEKGKNLSSRYPDSGKNNLSDQLKIVAQMIAGGLKTPVYVVNMDGFDTHADQVIPTDKDKGRHAGLLEQLSVAINAFQDDLRLLNLEDRVAGMTFSEFGRRIGSNASGGTDHGTAAPVFVFGKNVNPGIIGKNPVISPDISSEDNLPMTHDFRQVYYSVLKDWFEIGDDAVKHVLFRDYGILPIFRKKTDPGNNNVTGPLANYPNPVTDSALIRFYVKEPAHVTIKLYDMQGRFIRFLFDKQAEAGPQTIYFNRGGLPQGMYTYVLRSGAMQASGKMSIVN